MMDVWTSMQINRFITVDAKKPVKHARLRWCRTNLCKRRVAKVSVRGTRCARLQDAPGK
jgi:hypothetical protein